MFYLLPPSKTFSTLTIFWNVIHTTCIFTLCENEAQFQILLMGLKKKEKKKTCEEW